MKHLSIFSINNTLTKFRSLPIISWSSKRVKFISTIGNPVTIVTILIPVIALYCKCWQNKNGCVPKYTRPQHIPSTSSDINLVTIPAPVYGQPHQVMIEVIQEILKSCDMDLAKFECYKHCKANHQTTKF